MKKSLLLILVIARTVSLTSCKAKIPTNEHSLMLSISSSKSLIEHSEDDSFGGSSWMIYYDGQVEFENKYNISGTADEQSWTLDVEQLTNLYEILDGDFKKMASVSFASTANIVIWTFVFYDEYGDIAHRYEGFKNSEIVEIISQDDLNYLQ